MKYKVIVSETQYYELYVEAEDKDEAEDIALEEYGCIGDIYSILTDVELIEEVKQFKGGNNNESIL
jgi:hypothetical protein